MKIFPTPYATKTGKSVLNEEPSLPFLQVSNVWDFLACPSCADRLIVEEKEILCSGCSMVFPIIDGVMDFLNGRKPGLDEQPYFPKWFFHAKEKISHFNRVHYDESSFSGRLEIFFKKELMKIVGRHPRPFLDIGCGSGTGFEQLGYPFPIIGIDSSLELLKKAKAKYPNALLICCDITSSSPIAKESVPVIFSMATLEHVFFLERFVEGIYRLLHPSGVFYVLVPNEGGLAWGILRVLAHFKYSKLLKLNYKKYMKYEHCNSIFAIQNVLKKYFDLEIEKDIPFRFGGASFNFVRLFKARKKGN